MAMDWKEEYSNKHQSNNYYGIFTTKHSDIAIKAYIYVTVPMREYNDKRIMFVRLYYKSSKEQIEHIFHEISDSCFELAKNYINDDINSIFKTAFFEYYSVNRFPSDIAFSFGDYSY